MGDTRSPGRDSRYFYSCSSSVKDNFHANVQDGENLVSLVIAGKDAPLPRSQPKQLKNDLVNNITNRTSIERVYFSGQGNLNIITKNTRTVQELLDIKTLLDVPVTSHIQTDTITSRFLLSIDTSVPCNDIVTELEDQGFHVHEARRFMRKSENTYIPTRSVLISIFGTTLPSEVFLWLQRFRVSMFYDKPQQCSNCYRYTHSTKSCRSDKRCAFCSKSHPGECTSTSYLCINCEGPHTANDPTCPLYLREVQFQKFRSENHLTISEARRLFTNHTVTSTATYAKIASSAPSDNISKKDFEPIIESLTSQFTSMLNEVRQEMQDMARSFKEQMQEMAKEFNKQIQETANDTRNHIRETHNLYLQMLQKHQHDSQTKNTIKTSTTLSESENQKPKKIKTSQKATTVDTQRHETTQMDFQTSPMPTTDSFVASPPLQVDDSGQRHS